MGKLRILVVDDSVVVRRMLTEMLSSDPDLEVAATASNGKIALARIPQINPDAIILDVEMPEMNGLETLAGIRRTYLTVPVIMFSTITARGASATLDALALGATDYVTKPSSRTGAAGRLELARADLIEKIKTHCAIAANAARAAWSETVAAPAPSLAREPQFGNEPPRNADVVAIGVSTGGPNALAEVIPLLSANFGAPVLIVQHMPPLFTKMLAERLALRSHIPVTEASSGDLVVPGRVLIAPGDFHIVVERHDNKYFVKTHQAPPENSCRPAVDVLFRSVAEIYGTSALAVVMTGMGQDGLRGSEMIRARGGQVIAQDEASSVVWGMPGFVAKAGLASCTVPLSSIADEIMLRIRKSIVPIRTEKVVGHSHGH